MQVPEEVKKAVSGFIDEVKQLVGDRLKEAMLFNLEQPAEPDPVICADILLVVSGISTKEEYRIWDRAGDASVANNILLAVVVYPADLYERAKELPFLKEAREKTATL